MHSTNRRDVLAGIAAATLGVAGCLDEGDQGLHAVNAQLVRGGGYPDIDHPTDVGVRVTVENDAKRRLEGTVVAELDRLGSDGSSEAVESWTDEREVSLSSLTTQGYLFVFEDANPEGDADARFRAETHMSERSGSD